MKTNLIILIIGLIVLAVLAGVYIYVSQNTQPVENGQFAGECIREGESLLRQGDSVCCANLSQVLPTTAYDENCADLAPAGPFDVCIACGNGVCGLGENKCNCPSDCQTTKNDSTKCVKEGEKPSVCTGSSGVCTGAVQDPCCTGLTKVADSYLENGYCTTPFRNEATICTYCGNGVCGLGENKCNCPVDCQ